MRVFYLSTILSLLVILTACQTRLRPIENVTVDCDTAHWLPREDVLFYDVHINGETQRVLPPNHRLHHIPQGAQSLVIEYTTTTQKSARSQAFTFVSTPRLEAPENLSIQNGRVTFDPVPGATSYLIQVGEARFEVTDTQFDISDLELNEVTVVEVSAAPFDTCQHVKAIRHYSPDSQLLFEAQYVIDLTRQRQLSYPLESLEFVEARVAYGDAQEVTWEVNEGVLEFAFSPLIKDQSQAVVVIETGLGSGVIQFTFTTQEAPFLISPSTQLYRPSNPLVFEFSNLSDVRFELYGPNLSDEDFEVVGNDIVLSSAYLASRQSAEEALLILQYRLIRGQDVQIGFFFIQFES